MSQNDWNALPTIESDEQLQATLQHPTEIWSEIRDGVTVYRFIRKLSDPHWHVVVAQDAGDDLEIDEELTLSGARAMHEYRIGARLELK